MTNRVIELVREATRGRGAKFESGPERRTEVIGTSRQGRELVAVHCGDAEVQKPVCVVVAGMHSDELTGVAAAVEIIETALKAGSLGYRLIVIPALDIDGVVENLDELDEDNPMVSILGLQPGRDLEGDFCREDHPEVVAMRRWLDGLSRLDGYLSLHATNHLVPGGFAYAGGRAGELVETVATVVGARMAGCGLPRLASDPTGMGGKRIADGVFGIPEVEGASIEFVERRFDPAVLFVSEFPVGLVEPHGPIALEKLDVWRASARPQNGSISEEIRPFVEPQVELLCQIVGDVCRATAVMEG